MPLIRVCAVNGTIVGARPLGSARPKRAVANSTIERPSGVSSARLDASAASASSTSRDVVDRQQLGGLAGAEGDRARLVEQQRRHVARGLDGAAGHGQHVALHEAVHAGDADRRQQPADRRRDQAHEQGDEHDDRLLGAAVDGERLQRHDGQQEDDRQAGEQDRQGDLVRRLLPVGPLDEGDHAVEERLAGPGGDAHDDLVGQHPRAARDGRAVATRLPDDGRRLAGDRRLVDGGDALDRRRRRRGSPRRRSTTHRSPIRSCDDGTTRRAPPSRRTRATVSLRVLRSVAACALPRPSAIASAKLAKSTVNQRNTTTRPAKTFSSPSTSRRGRGGTGSSSAPSRPRRRTSPGCGPACAGRA